MRNTFSRLMKLLLRLSGLPILFREVIQRNRVTILLFHDLSPSTADGAFSYLSKRYNIISLQDFIQACRERDASKVPPKALIITFDDGHIGNYELLPVLVRHQLPVTIFLCAALVDTDRHYWFTHDHGAVSLDVLKRKPNKDRLALLSEIDFEQDKEYEEPQALQRSHIDEMKQYVDFQSHTMFHSILPMCGDAEAKEEIFASRDLLEQEYGLKIDAISYPNGDYSNRDITFVKQAGYECGLTVDFGFNTVETDLFRLRRLDVNDADDMSELMVKASGVWAFFKTQNGRKQRGGLRGTVEQHR